MPGRPNGNTDGESRREDAARPRGGIPFGALFLLAVIALVFLYGIYLKAMGPSATASSAGAARSASGVKTAGTLVPPRDQARLSHGTLASVEPGSRSQSSPDQTPGDIPLEEAAAAARNDAPVIPESAALGSQSVASPSPGAPGARPSTAVASNLPAGRAASGASTATSTPTGSTADGSKPEASGALASPVAASAAARPEAGSATTAATAHTAGAAASGAASTPVSPPPTSSSATASVKASVPSAPAVRGAPAGKTSGSGPSPTGNVGAPAPTSGAPRGSAPATVRKRARDLFAGRKYAEAAEAWSDWAATIPPGSWTVQIAAVNLAKAGTSDSLSRLAGRDDVFVLAPGALRGGLAPVCTGIYDSEQAARRAASGLSLPSGSTSRPMPKPVQSLLASR